MLLNQIHRDGPRIARSFDQLAKNDLDACSCVLGRVSGMLVNQLRRPYDNSFKATAARLLLNACHSYIASLEVARHGYPRQYGAVARMVVEAVATVIAIAIREGALEQFHAGTLESSKCITLAKKVLPLGLVWGSLSNDFVHIGRNHALLERPLLYTRDHEAIGFLLTSIRCNALSLYIVADLVFSDEHSQHHFWKRAGQEAHFDPASDVRAWMENFCKPIIDEVDAFPD
jgi:hypothetical protein